MDALIELRARRGAEPIDFHEHAVGAPAPPSDSALRGEVSPVRPEAAAPAGEPAPAVVATEVLRFHRSEILVHWTIALPFMICFLTGFVLKVFFNLDQTVLRASLSWVHRTSGGCLVVLPLLVAVWHWKDLGLHLGNVRKAWSWTRHDLRWLVFSGLAAAGFKVTLPEQHKFNAGEKVNFMILTCTYPLFAVTGLLIWLPGVPIASWILHVTVAAAVAPVMLGHIFMATVNRDTRPGLSGMISGHVDRTWAKHHYRLWYREHHEAAEVAARSAERGVLAEPVAADNRPVTSLAQGLRIVEEPGALTFPTGGKKVETVHEIPSSGAVVPRRDEPAVATAGGLLADRPSLVVDACGGGRS